VSVSVTRVASTNFSYVQRGLYWTQHPSSSSTSTIGQRALAAAAGRPSIHPSVRLSIFPLSPFVLPVSAADMTPWPGEVIEMRHGIHWPHQLSIKLTAPAAAADAARVAVYLTPVMARSSNLALRTPPSTSHGNTFYFSLSFSLFLPVFDSPSVTSQTMARRHLRDDDESILGDMIFRPAYEYDAALCRTL